MTFAAYPVQTQTPYFMDLWLLTINALNEISVFSNTATRIQRPTYGSYWSTPDHIYGEAKEVGRSGEKSDHEYNYKNKFQI